MQKWLLPEYIEDILPAEAARLETLRRQILDLFLVHGYELVIPPLVEYLDSLLTGTGHDLELRTFKLIDQLSGRTLGLRADITPQTARIDAHLLNRNGVTRLCYSGSVLHALPAGLTHTREPLQIGAEIYGHNGLESDLEIQALMLRALGASGVAGVHMDIGHVAVFRALVRQAGVRTELEAELFRALQTKDAPALGDLTKSLDAPVRDALRALPSLYGGADMLSDARKALPPLPEITAALDALETVARQLDSEAGELCFDLAELRGYHYHSGVVFAAYVRGGNDAIARGGRYDDIGRSFGRARPATGFSIDLRELAANAKPDAVGRRVLAPYRPDDADLQREIRALRESGVVVVVDLPGHEDAVGELGCNARLIKRAGRWTQEAQPASGAASKFSDSKG